MTVRVYITADVPAELAQRWLQHIRDFDAAHPGCHFAITADAHEMSTEAITKMLQSIDPPFDTMQVLKRQ